MIPKKEINRVLLIDWSIFLHKSVHIWSKTKQIPATYTALNMIFSCLRILKIEPNDLLIVAQDGKNNWRKQIDTAYKGNRKDVREKSDIDWNYWFKEFDLFSNKLIHALPFHFIKIDTLEADDIIATACKYYHDKEVIVVSCDSDFEQLAAHKNVKLFSTITKEFKVVKNPYQIIAKKIEKEKTDNLITEIKTEEDFQRRNLIVNLLTLPKEIEQKAIDRFDSLCYNDYNVEILPFKSLRGKLMDIYNEMPYEKKGKKTDVYIGSEIF